MQPYLEDLAPELWQPPSPVTSFVMCLLKTENYSQGSAVKLIVSSYSADLIHGVTSGRVLRAKHFHNITGQKKPIQIINRLGHCMDYNMVCETETAHAHANQQLSKVSGSVPLTPLTENHAVMTFFGLILLI